MGDADKKLNIGITTSYEGSGAKEASKDVDSLGGTTKNATGANKELTGEMGNLKAATGAAAQGMEGAAQATEKVTVSKHTLGKIIQKLTVDFPMLGSVARMALNPIVFAVAGPIAAFGIFKARVDAATKALGGIEMPDLSAGLAQANQYAIAWNGVAEAIAKANKEFNSDEGVFKRSEDAIGKQLDADKKVDEMDKQKALANLELQKGRFTEGQYALNKAGIESYYGKKQFGMEQSADQRRADAKSKEIFDATRHAEELGKKASALEAPEDSQAKITSLKTSTEHFQTVAKNARDEAAKARDLAEVMELGTDKEKIKASPAALSFFSAHGYDADPNKIAFEQDKIARDAEAQAKAQAKEVRHREQKLKDDEQLRGEAAEAAGLSQRLNNEAPGFSADMRRSRATSTEVHAGEQQVNTDKVFADVSKGGQDMQALVRAINTTIGTANKGTITEFQKLHKIVTDHATEIAKLKETTNLH